VFPPDLTFSALHNCIHPTYIILGTPTIPTTTNFHHGSVSNAAHSVPGFGVKIPTHA
jgi:hypothetical protein